MRPRKKLKISLGRGRETLNMNNLRENACSKRRWRKCRSSSTIDKLKNSSRITSSTKNRASKKR